MQKAGSPAGASPLSRHSKIINQRSWKMRPCRPLTARGRKALPAGCFIPCKQPASSSLSYCWKGLQEISSGPTGTADRGWATGSSAEGSTAVETWYLHPDPSSPVPTVIAPTCHFLCFPKQAKPARMQSVDVGCFGLPPELHHILPLAARNQTAAMRFWSLFLERKP